MIGLPAAEAIVLLREVGLVPALDECAIDGTRPERGVIDQVPSAGQPARPGNIVTLVIGRCGEHAGQPEPELPATPNDATDTADNGWYDLPPEPTSSFAASDLEPRSIRDGADSVDVPCTDLTGAGPVRVRLHPGRVSLGAAALALALAAVALLRSGSNGPDADALERPAPRTVVITVSVTRPAVSHVTRGELRPRRRRSTPHLRQTADGLSGPEEPERPRLQPSPSPSDAPPAASEPPPTAPAAQPCELCFEHP